MLNRMEAGIIPLLKHCHHVVYCVTIEKGRSLCQLVPDELEMPSSQWRMSYFLPHEGISLESQSSQSRSIVPSLCKDIRWNPLFPRYHLSRLDMKTFLRQTFLLSMISPILHRLRKYYQWTKQNHPWDLINSWMMICMCAFRIHLFKLTYKFMNILLRINQWSYFGIHFVMVQVCKCNTQRLEYRT